MIDREDLVFATCYQLSQIISSDWEESRPGEVTDALDVLKPIDEPGECFNGVPIDGNNPLRLTPSEKEPESLRTSRRLIELKILVNVFKVIMKHSDGWETENSDIIKREIISRISNYEYQAKAIITPEPFKCNISV